MWTTQLRGESRTTRELGASALRSCESTGRAPNASSTTTTTWIHPSLQYDRESTQSPRRTLTTSAPTTTQPNDDDRPPAAFRLRTAATGSDTDAFRIRAKPFSRTL